MMSLRLLARSVPHAAFKSAAPSSFRSLSTIRQPSFYQSSWKVASTPVYKSFATTQFRSEPAGEADIELSSKLSDEVSLELQASDPAALSDTLQDYLDNSPFKLVEKSGSEEVSLTRTFGNETITVSFTIDALKDAQQEYEPDQDDNALFDEDISAEVAQANSSKGLPAEDGVEAGESPFAADEPGFRSGLSIVVEKPGNGSLLIHAVSLDGEIEVQDVEYFPKGLEPDAQTAEKEWAKRDLYAGPEFANLDEELQLLFYKYLDERGVNAALANFVPEYIEFKEQKEYVSWLKNVKSFIEA